MTKLALALTLVVTLLCACGKPPQRDLADYVGLWRGPDMELQIDTDGNVRYQRNKRIGNTSISAPFKAFTDDGFKVGVGPLATEFKVTQPPHRDGTSWKMTIDGVELTRIDKPDAEPEAGTQSIDL